MKKCLCHSVRVMRQKVKSTCERSLYGLKQAFRQWFLKFDQYVTSFGSKATVVYQCIYLKGGGVNFFFFFVSMSSRSTY